MSVFYIGGLPLRTVDPLFTGDVQVNGYFANSEDRDENTTNEMPLIMHSQTVQRIVEFCQKFQQF